MKFQQTIFRFGSYSEFKNMVANHIEKYDGHVVGHYVTPCYIVEITVKDYKSFSCLNYTIYNKARQHAYLNGGMLCELKKLPSKEKKFWKLAEKAVSAHVDMVTAEIHKEFKTSWGFGFTAAPKEVAL